MIAFKGYIIYERKYIMGHQLTRQDIEKMEQEIEHRKLVERPRLIEDVKEARAQGDLSENFEYYAAKKAKNINESRIRFLDRMIRTASVIEDEAGSDQVGVGDSVTVRYEEDGFEDTYMLVTTMGADSLNNMISIESPIGKALRGKCVGDKVKVSLAKNDEFFVTIISVKKGDGEYKLNKF